MSDFTESDFPNPGRNILRVVLWTTLFLCLVVFSAATWLLMYSFNQGPATGSTSVIIDIPKGTSVRGISKILGEGKVITDDIRFLLLAKLLGVSSKLQAGEFQLPTGRTPVEVLELLSNAKPVQHSVTIPEGLRADEIAELFANEGWCERDTFVELVKDSDFISRLNLPDVSSLEGYLYPDTYYLTRDIRGADKIITLLVQRFQTVWQELIVDLDPPPDQKKTVILASIVEKETGASSERPLIASVFHNRLKIGMRLQSDPTVVYGVDSYNGTITKTHLRTPTPYNTYVIGGLPVGPIANPGKAALDAVIHPATTKYLYFVSKNDGTHQFSANLRDHNRAVQKFQR